MPKKVFVAGMYLDHVHPNAPEFIITNQTIQVEKFIAWLQENRHLANEKGYLRIVGKESNQKDDKGINKRYFEVDTWKPTLKTEPTPTTTTSPVMPEYPEDINPEDVPF